MLLSYLHTYQARTGRPTKVVILFVGKTTHTKPRGAVITVTVIAVERIINTITAVKS